MILMGRWRATGSVFTVSSVLSNGASVSEVSQERLTSPKRNYEVIFLD